jgi:hypothetical protein
VSASAAHLPIMKPAARPSPRKIQATDSVVMARPRDNGVQDVETEVRQLILCELPKGGGPGAGACRLRLPRPGGARNDDPENSLEHANQRIIAKPLGVGQL